MLKRFVRRYLKRSRPIDEESDISTLINQLGEVDAHIPYRASKALVARGPSVVPALLEVLEVGNSRARDHAAYVLRMLKAQETVEPLLKLLTHPVVEVRWHAADILGSLGDQRAVEPLIERLQRDENDTVRYFVVCSLGQLKDQRAFEPLLQTFNDSHSHSHPNSRVRSSAAEVLLSFKNEPDFELLTTMLNDREDEVRATAIWYLRGLGDERALPALEWMAKHDTGYSELGPIKDVAARAIKSIKKKRGAPK